MPVSHKHNCIFIHIPKTAGTSIEASLGMHGDLNFVGYKPYVRQTKNKNCLFGKGLQHLTALQIKKRIKNYDDYFKFTFVRNPWDRVVSAVFWRANGLGSAKLDADTSKASFKKELQSVDMTSAHFKPQLSYIRHRGNLLVDFIGRFENLTEDADRIGKKVFFDFPLEHRMKSCRKHYTEYYDDETRELVSNYYAKDIEYFGYEFGE